MKARIADPQRARETAARLSGGEPEILHQIDTFFPSKGARLKLRILGPGSGELIRYERSDLAGTRTSHYVIARTQDPQILRDILTEALGTAGMVTKTRLLYMIGQTRVHIDAVENLGDFLELEVVLRPDQEETEGQAIAQRLVSDFGISQDQLVAEAYVDLLNRG